MIRGIYNAASGMNLEQQIVDDIAHNLANVNTTGFKRREPVARSFGDVLVEFVEQTPGSNNHVGMGVHLDELARDERTGNLRNTGNPLDVALASSGHYFVVQRRDGSRALTRDGQFYRDDQGQLVTAQGELVLSETRAPIAFNSDLRNIKFREDGTILGSDSEIAKLLIVAPTPNGLKQFPAVSEALVPAQGVQLKQGFLESSNVNIVQEMVGLIEANRRFGSDQKAITAQDQMLQKAASEIAKS